MLNKAFYALLLALLLRPLWAVAATQAVLIPAPPSLASEAYVLMDADSGRILIAKNADQRLEPASLTKMMTSYILSAELSKGSVRNEDMVLVSKNAWAQNPIFQGSSLMFIEVGKEVSLLDLHRGIVISSGNDACVAVAEYLAGSEDAFADIMNQQAELLGMKGSHFVNSHGLPDAEHYTTAMDMAILARAIIRDFPEDYTMYSERSFTFNGIPQSNRNSLLWQDQTVDGLKTGYTAAAGYGLVASSLRKDMRLIAVVMGAKSTEARARENQKLLQYGFRYYETIKLYSAGEQLTEARIWGGEKKNLSMGVADDIYLTIAQGERDSLQAELEFGEVISAPITMGETLGKLKLSVAGEPVSLQQPSAEGVDAELDPEQIIEPDLVALETVEEAGLVARLWDKLVLFIYQLLGLATR
jgi:D-alanyl-D-alanine carboxypeptidase (penicillin-binding protein 5/6)